MPHQSSHPPGEIPLPRKLTFKEESFSQRGIHLPESVFRISEVKYQPRQFVVGGGNSRMKEKTYQREVQDRSLLGFLNQPTQPIVYGVSTQSDHAHSLYVAAYLAHEFMKNTHGSNRVTWLRGHQLFNQPTIPETTALLVITGLTPNTPKFTLDKVANLLDKWDHIPRIVSITGEDPITFFALSLYYRVDRIYFHAGNSVSREVEIL
jgi:hypothetical protein